MNPGGSNVIFGSWDRNHGQSKEQNQRSRAGTKKYGKEKDEEICKQEEEQHEDDVGQ